MKASLIKTEITSIEQALKILDDPLEDQLLREHAIRYLSYRPDEEIIKRLVWALQDDEFGVRWEAANTLAELGGKALPELLKALTDPDRIGDPRLREAAYHALRYNHAPFNTINISRLLQALKGPAADISSMEEAGRILAQIEK